MNSMFVEALWIYPVKSCAGIRVQAAQVAERGFRGDRRWMIVDEAGRHLTQREFPSMALIKPELVQGGLRFAGGPQVSAEQTRQAVGVTVWGDPVEARPAPELVNQWLSDTMGASVRLVYMPDTSVRPVDPDFGRPGDAVSFADGYPYLVTNTRSLEDLNERMESPIPMRRFRPNIVVAGDSPFEEDRWRRIKVGSILFDIPKLCARCVIVDTDPSTGIRKKGVLSTLAKFRRVDGKVLFGQNAIARGQGSLSVRDPVEVVEAKG